MALGNSLSMRPKSEEPSLNITSMMDMFTIIVFFLLFSYSAKPQEITVDKHIDLPGSNSSFNYANSVKLYLSKSDIKIEENVVAQIKDGRIVNSKNKGIESSALYQRLKQHKSKQIEKYKVENPGEADIKEFHLLFFCDRNLPFKTMNEIMKIAARAGYPNFQLAVLEK